MSNGVKLILDNDLLTLVDKYRGDLSRDEFIIQVLNEHLNNQSNDVSSVSETEFIDLDSDNTDLSEPLTILMNDFKDFAKNVKSRLDKLEDYIYSQPIRSSSMKNQVGLSDSEYDDMGSEINPTTKTRKSYKVTSGDREELVFEVLDSDQDSDSEIDDDFDTEPSNKDIDRTSQESKEDNSDDDFEYGCPFCNATIEKNATECRNCGNRFHDEEVDVDTEDDAAIVEPLSSGYDESGRYDPRPRYLKTDRDNTDHVNSCSKCGDELTYIKEYKRWYCYNCKKYAVKPTLVKGQFSIPKFETSSSKLDDIPGVPRPPEDDFELENQNMKRKKFLSKQKPLKKYPKYRD
jgi:ribosomal protein L37AE/L43A